MPSHLGPNEDKATKKRITYKIPVDCLDDSLSEAVVITEAWNGRRDSKAISASKIIVVLLFFLFWVERED